MPMMRDNMNLFNVSAIECFFDSILRGTLTDNLFFGEVTPATSKNWKEWVIVDVGNPMRNYDAYSVGTVLILVYLRNNKYGQKDVKRMKEMEEKLNEIILTSEDPHYHINKRHSYANYDAVNDIFFNVIQINLVIT